MVRLNNTVPVKPYNTGITGGMPGVQNNKVPPPPHNTGITGGMQLDPKLTNAPKKIFMPTRAQLIACYRSIADNAFASHTAKLLKKAPKGADKQQGLNITKKGIAGARQEAFELGGKLYVKVTPVVPHPQSKWYAVGYAPKF